MSEIIDNNMSNFSQCVVDLPILSALKKNLTDSMSRLWKEDFEPISWHEKKIGLPESFEGIWKIYKLPKNWEEALPYEHMQRLENWGNFVMIWWNKEYIVLIQNNEVYVILWLNHQFPEDLSLNNLYRRSIHYFKNTSESVKQKKRIMNTRFSPNINFVLIEIFEYSEKKWIDLKQEYISDLDEVILQHFEEKRKIQEANIKFLANKRKIKLDDIYNISFPYKCVNNVFYTSSRGHESFIGGVIDFYGESEFIQHIWCFCSNNSILAFVWPTGRIYIARNKKENREELKELWYREWVFWVPFSNQESNLEVDIFMEEELFREERLLLSFNEEYIKEFWRLPTDEEYIREFWKVPKKS